MNEKVGADDVEDDIMAVVVPVGEELLIESRPVMMMMMILP